MDLGSSQVGAWAGRERGLCRRMAVWGGGHPPGCCPVLNHALTGLNYREPSPALQLWFEGRGGRLLGPCVQSSRDTCPRRTFPE